MACDFSRSIPPTSAAAELPCSSGRYYEPHVRLAHERLRVLSCGPGGHQEATPIPSHSHRPIEQSSHQLSTVGFTFSCIPRFSTSIHTSGSTVTSSIHLIVLHSTVQRRGSLRGSLTQVSFRRLTLIKVIHRLHRSVSFIIKVVMVTISGSSNVVRLRAMLGTLSTSKGRTRRPILIRPHASSNQSFGHLTQLWRGHRQYEGIVTYTSHYHPF